MFGAFCAAVGAFAATNIDDLFVLMLLFGQAERRAERGRIAAGQFAGIGLLTAVSLAGAAGLGLLPEGGLRLLGLIPAALGVRAWLRRGQTETPCGSALSVPAVAALTVANGGDNIGVYLPLLARMNGGERAVTVAVFALLCGLWCWVSARLASLPAVKTFLVRCRDWLVPVVLILLGLSILLR